MSRSESKKVMALIYISAYLKGPLVFFTKMVSKLQVNHITALVNLGTVTCFIVCKLFGTMSLPIQFSFLNIFFLPHYI